jgi:hypothetical protein
MSHKKHGLFTLIKVGIVAFLYIGFYEHIFFEKNPRYSKLQHITYSMLKLGIATLFFTFMVGILLGNDNIIPQICFIVYFCIIAYGIVFGMIEYFKIWHFFFKKFLDERDKNE